MLTSSGRGIHLGEQAAFSVQRERQSLRQVDEVHSRVINCLSHYTEKAVKKVD